MNPGPAESLTVLEEKDFPRWDQFVMDHPYGSVYHTTSWMRVIQKTYKHQPLYVFLEQEGRIHACFPLFRIRSWVTGDRLNCLPAATICDPLADGEQLEKIMRFVQGRIGLECWIPWEIKTTERFSSGVPFQSRPVRGFVTHLLDLQKPLEEIWGSFHRNQVVRSILKAMQSEIEVVDCCNQKGMVEFYELYLNMRRKLGLLPQPRVFFQNLLEEFGPEGKLQIYLARSGSRPVSGVLLLKYKDLVTYEYGATEPSSRKQRPNQLLLWRSIQNAHAEGYRWFDFGRTSLDNEGLLSFKDRWGTSRVHLVYYQVPGGTKIAKMREKNLFPLAMRILVQSSPGFVCQWFGRRLYRHIL